MTSKKLDIHSNVTPVEVPVTTVDMKQAARDKLARIQEEDMKMVKGVFQNFETPGGSLPLQIRKYKGHFFNQVLEDGKEYSVPLYVARHLNGFDAIATHIDGKVGTCSYPISSYLMDASGSPIISTAKRKKRFGFQSMEFAASSV